MTTIEPVLSGLGALSTSRSGVVISKTIGDEEFYYGEFFVDSSDASDGAVINALAYPAT